MRCHARAQDDGGEGCGAQSLPADATEAMAMVPEKRAAEPALLAGIRSGFGPTPSVPKLQRRDVALAILFPHRAPALISATSCARGSSARGSPDYTSMHPPCAAVAPKACHKPAAEIQPPTHASAARVWVEGDGGCGSDPSRGGLGVGTVVGSAACCRALEPYETAATAATRPRFSGAVKTSSANQEGQSPRT